VKEEKKLKVNFPKTEVLDNPQVIFDFFS